MHKQNVRCIVFRGIEGKKAISQILNAKPVVNEFTSTVEKRSFDFAKNFSVTVNKK